MKTLKPTEIDATLLYICPNDDCKNEHWVYLREAKTKNFKVVCECGEVFKTKTIQQINIKYNKKNLTKKIVQDDKNPNVDLLAKCVKTLLNYGFSKQEAEDLVIRTYKEFKIDDPIKLIKKSFESLEINNV